MNHIKLLVMDVDGTLTDGKIYMSAEGELLKAFNIKDGYAIAHLPEKDIIPVIITGRSSKILLKRCGELGILELHQGIENKVSKLLSICDTYQVKPSNVAYIGDDINDIKLLEKVEWSAVPSSAPEYVRNIANIHLLKKGGEGAFREFVEVIFGKELIHDIVNKVTLEHQ